MSNAIDVDSTGAIGPGILLLMVANAVAYPGFQREGCLRSGPIQIVGGRFRSDIRKVGGGGGVGAIPLQVRYLWAHRKYLHVPTYVLPRYTSHARANERKIHAGKG